MLVCFLQNQDTITVEIFTYLQALVAFATDYSTEILTGFGGLLSAGGGLWAGVRRGARQADARVEAYEMMFQAALLELGRRDTVVGNSTELQTVKEELIKVEADGRKYGPRWRSLYERLTRLENGEPS